MRPVIPASLLSPFLPALHERLTLLLNHMLGAEGQAMDRLRPHAGRSLSIQAPGLALRFLVTPAGLLEACPPDPSPADLAVRLVADHPLDILRAAAEGTRPRIDVQGDGDFAAAVDWLVAHLRWDIEDDLARVIGDAPAHELARLGREAAQVLHRFAGEALRRAAPPPPRV